MAFPFLYLALYIILDQYNAGRAIKDWILITILYEVVMGTVLGAIIGMEESNQNCREKVRGIQICV
jgi:sodium/hydrogen antiporter